MPQAQADELRKWLGKAQLESLKKIAVAQVIRYQAEALRDALESSPENSKLETANLALRTAKRFQTFVDVLDEFATQKTPYQIAKLT